MEELIYELFFYIDTALCTVIDYLYAAFKMCAGVEMISYGGNRQYLIDVFFNHRSINTIYWGMALIGIVLTFGFTIMAVIKKIFDIEDKVKNTLGGIIGSAGKAFFVILIMNFIVMATISMSNTLMQQITYLFDNADYIAKGKPYVYNEKQYATMARCINTIGNYSLAPARDSRYNVNDCFNEIREDLKVLRADGLFAPNYRTYAEEYGESWQSILASIAVTASLDEDLYANDYNEGLTRAMTYAFDVLETNNSFYPLQKFTESDRVLVSAEKANLGAMLFMSGSFDASKNPDFNGQYAKLTDTKRRPFVTGEKDYTNMGQVSEEFQLYGGEFKYFTVALVCFFMIKELIVVVINCIARIFNLMLLYITAPPFAATMPYDDGAKFKQWSVAFVIQAFSLIGTIITMRLFMIFLPIIMSNDLVLFNDNSTAELFIKVIMLIGLISAVRGSSGLITGILAEQAGMNAIRAGDIGREAISSTIGNAKMAFGGVRSGLGLARRAGGLAKGAVTSPYKLWQSSKRNTKEYESEKAHKEQQANARKQMQGQSKTNVNNDSTLPNNQTEQTKQTSPNNLNSMNGMQEMQDMHSTVGDEHVPQPGEQNDHLSAKPYDIKSAPQFLFPGDVNKPKKKNNQENVISAKKPANPTQPKTKNNQENVISAKEPANPNQPSIKENKESVKHSGNSKQGQLKMTKSDPLSLPPKNVGKKK